MARNRSKSSSFKEAYYILCLLVFFAAAIFAFLSPRGFMEMRKVQRELEIRRARVEALRRTNSERMESIERLKSDKDAQEKYAREQGYARKDEIILRTQEESADPGQKKPPRKP